MPLLGEKKEKELLLKEFLPFFKNERIEKYIQAIVDKEVMMRFPQRSGPVLRNQIDNQKWVDFINKDKKNGSTNP